MTTANTRHIATRTPQAAVAALATMACGAAALYITFAWAKLDSDGALAPFLVGIVVPAVIIGGIGAMRRATSTRTSDSEGFTLGMLVLVVAIVCTVILMVWAISGGWAWPQFWYGLAVLGLWAVATAIHLTHKYYSH